MGDLISRSDAMDAIAQYCIGCESCNGVRCRGTKESNPDFWEPKE